MSEIGVDMGYIYCVGVDHQKHMCKPEETLTHCGVKVIKKKLTSRDHRKYFSCYECTY